MVKYLLLLALLVGHAGSAAGSASGGLEPPPMQPSASYPLRHEGKVIFLYGDPSATLVCAPLDLCVISLQPGERVQPNGVHIGDSVRWQIKPTVGANETTQVVLKPFAAGIETSLALVTDRRTYHLRLMAREEGSMPLVMFHYPTAIKAAWQAYYREQAAAKQRRRLPATGEDISKLDFEYRISGCGACEWRPERVYNNGKLTILHMGPGVHQGELPALLVRSPQGEIRVNYRIQGDRYIVDRVFDRAILILGTGRDQQLVEVSRRQARSATSEAFAWAD